MSLEHAYGAKFPEVTAHLAAWELMWTHARTQHSTLDLVPLIVQALAAPLSEDGALYLARLGLESRGGMPPTRSPRSRTPRW